jgi:hypothetical protein
MYNIYSKFPVRKFLYLSVIVILFSSCDPYLSRKTVARKFFKSTQSCSQGPFTFKTKSIGAPWGEQISLLIYSKTEVKFKYNLKVKTKIVQKNGSIGTIQENEYCFAQKGEKRSKTQSSTDSIPENKPPVIVNKTVENNKHDKITQKLIPIPESTVVKETDRTYYDSKTRTKKRYHRYNLQIIYSKIQNYESKNPYIRGTPIEITIWSIIPNNLKSVYFEFIHQKFTPNNHKKWIAFLDKKAQKAKTDQKRKEKKWAAYKRKRFLARLQICYMYKDKQGREWKTCRQFYNDKMKTYCLQQGRKNRGCWGTHLKSVTKKRYNRPKPRKIVYQKRKPRKVKIYKPMERSLFIVDKPLKNPTNGSTIQPSSPPPSPLKEVKTPSPSQNAQWINGYWKWNNKQWFWLNGFWRVPKSDITQGKTKKAPKLPPNPKNQAPIIRLPFPNAVWTTGYWMWQGNNFIWIKGRWVLSRGAKYRWIKPHWKKTPLGIFFIPGGWVTK